MLRTLTFPELLAIRRLLRAGVRHVEIAKRMRLSVGTISRIASDHKLRRRQHLDEADLPADDPPPDYDPDRLQRCPDCGGMVYVWPCLTCRMRGHGVVPRS